MGELNPPNPTAPPPDKSKTGCVPELIQEITWTGSGNYLNWFGFGSGSGKLPESSTEAFCDEPIQASHLNFQAIYQNLFKSALQR